MNWSSFFCMFGMALIRPSLTMQLTSGMDVFAHVCGQKVDKSSNYCDKSIRQETFFGNYHNFITSNFRKVVRQHTEVMEGNIIWVLLEIYLAFQQWKNFENPLRIDKVTAMSLGTTFLDTVYISGGEMSEGTAKCRSIQPCVVASKSRRHESTAVQAPHRMTPS